MRDPRQITRLAAAMLATAVIGAACGGSKYKEGEEVHACIEDERLCSGSTLQLCSSGSWVPQLTCTAPQVCSASLGRCAVCDPGRPICVGDEIHSCESGGQIGGRTATCPAGKCHEGTCSDPCAKAATNRSYVGCQYWPTVTMNDSLTEDFSFAVVVANAYSEPATITVGSSANAQLATATVGPNSLATIPLPWIPSLKGGQTTAAGSAHEAAGAYSLSSTLPVSVYQFNALDYAVNGDCRHGDDPDPSDGKCYSYTNDASLLLPEHALAEEYMVISRASLTFRIRANGQMAGSPGFFAVVAPGEGTTRVQVTFNAATQASQDGVIKAYRKGETATFDLRRWGVLQIASSVLTSAPARSPDATDSNADYWEEMSTDLTGTLIKANHAVAVFSGHDCAFVPFNKWACDHLEEQLFPTRAWGKRYLLTHPLSSGSDPAIYRVVSAENGNRITFIPESVHAPVTLQAGQHLEVTTSADFEVSGSARFAVAQFMVGQNYSNPNPGEGTPGDPSMSLAVPVEQYRTNYRFLTPPSYQQNYVNLTVPESATVTLDGKPIPEQDYSPLASGYRVARLRLSGGAHLAESGSSFGIVVYGVGAYTSYMYPGGLDLKLLE